MIFGRHRWRPGKNIQHLGLDLQCRPLLIQRGPKPRLRVSSDTLQRRQRISFCHRLLLRDSISQFQATPPALQQPLPLQVIYSQWPPSTRIKLQESLIWTGYSPGPLDGEIGERTLLAIRTFQGALGRPQTGLVTQAELNIERSGFQLVLDKTTGISIGIPKTILSVTRSAPPPKLIRKRSLHSYRSPLLFNRKKDSDAVGRSCRSCVLHRSRRRRALSRAG
jgi:hypothetical protein